LLAGEVADGFSATLDGAALFLWLAWQ